MALLLKNLSIVFYIASAYYCWNYDNLLTTCIIVCIGIVFHALANILTLLEHIVENKVPSDNVDNEYTD
jgi:hypothetical protein